MMMWEEPEVIYQKDEKFPLKQETYEIIGICMEVHRILGKGLLEVVYKDAIEHELKLAGIKYEREKKFEINYKGIILPHYFVADFIVGDIVLEVKSQNGLAADQYAQIINYITLSQKEVGLLINFGEASLKFKRFVI